MNQSLDSGLRRAAPGILGGLFQTPLYHLRPVGVPSRRIQDFLSINDGAARIKAIRLLVCIYRFVVIPAKAGIQEDDDGMPHETMIQSETP